MKPDMPTPVPCTVRKHPEPAPNGSRPNRNRQGFIFLHAHEIYRRIPGQLGRECFASGIPVVLGYVLEAGSENMSTYIESTMGQIRHVEPQPTIVNK